jgi:hypothetical protein
MELGRAIYIAPAGQWLIVLPVCLKKTQKDVTRRDELGAAARE